MIFGLDLGRPRIESPVKVNSELFEGIGDLRFSTGFKGSGREMEVFLFMEHQSSQDRLAAFRVLKYIMASYQERVEGEGVAAGARKPFPYPLAVVL